MTQREFFFSRLSRLSRLLASLLLLTATLAVAAHAGWSARGKMEVCR